MALCGVADIEDRLVDRQAQTVRLHDITDNQFTPATLDVAAGTTVVWTSVVSLVLFLALKHTIGLRPSKEVETEGLDINEHGERAYNY